VVDLQVEYFQNLQNLILILIHHQNLQLIRYHHLHRHHRRLM
jgi:hypothetical protein